MDLRGNNYIIEMKGNNKGRNKPFMTRRERFELKQLEKKRAAYEKQFQQELREVISMETSRSRRNAWKVASYMANKERQ